ncbi:tyrosine-type recombinase/integrase [Chloroflexota bacterium]
MSSVTDYKVYVPPTYLEPDEIRAIINAIPLVSGHIERDILLLETMWQTGGRVTEVLELVPKRIGENSLILRNLKQKPSSPPYKEVYITSVLANRLKVYCQKHSLKDEEYVFQPNRKSKGHLNRWYAWWIIGKAAGEANIKRVNTRKGDFAWAWPHLFRHSCGMFILDQTGQTEMAQRQLGHARITTTQGYAVLKLEKSRKGLADLKWE